MADRYGIPKIAPSCEDVLSDRDVDAVLICSSTDTHAELIMRAARARKHIFCEKPIAHDLAKIDAEAVARAGVKLQIGFNRRFDANFARVRRAVKTGEIGTPRLMHIVSYDPAPPPIHYVRVSGGMFLDMTIHNFGMTRFLIGDEVEEVFVSGAAMVDPEIGAAGDLDTAVIVLRFANGTLGTIENCRQAAYGYDQRVAILGSLSKIAIENCYPNQATVSTGSEVRRDLPLNLFIDRYRESFVAELRAFVDAVKHDGRPPVTSEDGRIPVVMGLAARKSYDERRPVRLAEVGQAVMPQVAIV